ncbi:hypothetical protein V6N13_030107 [Hibiscus sabdariffa]|uniref:Uncharacterized protein n=1 Tax=Hibiscus sabdariffa TaxID=183260 RepID=A0ABR2T8F7_9ROSI
MSSVCSPSCLRGGRDAGPGVPFRTTYLNLYKWPESDAEFVRSGATGRGVNPSVWCRQIYLRSYRFCRRESVAEKTVKFFGRVKERIRAHGKSIRNRKCVVWGKIKVALLL